MRPLLFFKYLMTITDCIESVASFACPCLFNVLLVKHPDLSQVNFIDAVDYYSSEADMIGLDMSKDELSLFAMPETDRRKTVWDLLISNLSEMELFTLMEAIFRRVFKRYLEAKSSIIQQRTIFADSIYALITIEEKMKLVTKFETKTEDARAERTVRAGKKSINDIHNTMITTILPMLNDGHRMLRLCNSPLQRQLNQFYKCILATNPALLADVEKTEPLLAT
jgi:hypothetical protein